MKTVLSIVIGAAILGAAFFVLRVQNQFKPEAVIVEKERVLPSVEVLAVEASSAAIEIPSQGLVQAVRQSTLTAEVAGRIAEVSPKFDVGERFEAGELILTIDDADYQTALAQADAAHAEARAGLASEQARAEQAKREWEKLGNGQPASDLTLRKPQLESTAARQTAALANLEKARRDLVRTRIVAPFAGRITQKRTDLGSYLTPGSPVAEFESTGVYQVRLPVSLADIGFLEDQGTDARVWLTMEASGNHYEWEARVLRSEGQIDRSSRSLYLIAEVKEEGEGASLLQPGLFVTARVQGRTLDRIFSLPRSAFINQDTLLMVDEENRLRLRQVKTIRPQGANMLVASGVEVGERVCLTQLGTPIDGAEVQVVKPEASAASAPAP